MTTYPSASLNNQTLLSPPRQACSISSSPVRKSRISPSGSELWILARLHFAGFSTDVERNGCNPVAAPLCAWPLQGSPYGPGEHTEARTHAQTHTHTHRHTRTQSNTAIEDCEFICHKIKSLGQLANHSGSLWLGGIEDLHGMCPARDVEQGSIVLRQGSSNREPSFQGRGPDEISLHLLSIHRCRPLQALHQPGRLELVLPRGMTTNLRSGLRFITSLISPNRTWQHWTLN